MHTHFCIVDKPDEVAEGSPLYDALLRGQCVFTIKKATPDGMVEILGCGRYWGLDFRRTWGVGTHATNDKRYTAVIESTDGNVLIGRLVGKRVNTPTHWCPVTGECLTRSIPRLRPALMLPYVKQVKRVAIKRSVAAELLSGIEIESETEKHMIDSKGRRWPKGDMWTESFRE